MKIQRQIRSFFLLILFPVFWVPALSAQEKVTWNASFESQLELAKENRKEIEAALRQATPEQKVAIEFLVENMPAYDLRRLSATYLLENVEQAIKARTSAKWKVPDDVFLNDVLPYRNVDESVEDWRRKLRSICVPLVKDCKTPAEAAQCLNQQLYKKVKVKCSTKRKKANQSPSESIEQGLASCTGLSILLVDACRSVGVPARIAGIAKWPNKRGNHTWVEIWSEGKWHFTGAAEYNPQGLNRTWFQADAALAKEDSRLNAVYAVSFKKTKTRFPLVWSRDSQVYAVNVTKRYVKPSEKSDRVRLLVRVWDKTKSERLVAKVVVTSSDGKTLEGMSKAGTADMNDMLSFQLPPNRKYDLKVEIDDQLKYQQKIAVGDAQTLIDVKLVP